MMSKFISETEEEKIKQFKAIQEYKSLVDFATKEKKI